MGLPIDGGGYEPDPAKWPRNVWRYHAKVACVLEYVFNGLGNKRRYVVEVRADHLIQLGVPFDPLTTWRSKWFSMDFLKPIRTTW